MKVVILLSVTLLLLFGSACALLPIPNSPLTDWTPFINGTYALSPILPGYGVPKWDPITTEIVTSQKNWTGLGLLLDVANKGYSPEQLLRRTLRAGREKGYGRPSVILTPSLGFLAGFNRLASDGSDMTDINLPSVEVSVPFWFFVTEASKINVRVYAVIRDDDANPVRLGWPLAATVISAIVLTALCLATMTVNIYKFQYHLRLTDGITTSKIFFSIDLLANLMRFWFVCVNPFFVNNIAYTWTTICTTTPTALTFICTLLLALKWRELLRKTSLKVTLFLTTFKWPFIILSMIIFAIEFVSSAMRGHWFSITNLSVASWSCLIIICAGITTLLFVSGIQIVFEINKAVGGTAGGRKTARLYKTTILILVSGVFLVWWLCNQIVLMIKVYHSKKVPSISYLQAATIMAFLSIMFTSLCQNLAMPIPNSNDTSSSSKGTGSRGESKHKNSQQDASTKSAGKSAGDSSDSEESEMAPLKKHDAQEDIESGVSDSESSDEDSS